MTVPRRRRDYSPYAYEIHEDPYPTYARLRDEAPALPQRRARVLGAVPPRRRARRLPGQRAVLVGRGRVARARGHRARTPHRTMSFLAMDPPRHGRMRGLVSRGFTPRRVADLEPRIRALTAQHLEPALERGTFDFIADFAGKLPDGRDLRDDRRARRRPGRGAPAGRPARPPRGGRARRAARRAWPRRSSWSATTPTWSPTGAGRPADDLTSALLAAEVDGDRLTDEEIIGFLFLMVVAGNETTTKLLGNAWYWAGRNPDERAKPFADPGRIPDWVEETLRYDTSSQMLARTVTGRRRPPRRGGARGRPGPAARRLGQPRRAGVRRPRPLRPRPADATQQLASFGSRPALLPRRVAGPARGPHRAGGAGGAGWPTTRSTTTACSGVHSVNVRGFAALPTTVRPR